MNILGALGFTLLIGFLIGIAWELLELAIYKQIQPRIVDDIILVVFMVIIFILKI